MKHMHIRKELEAHQVEKGRLSCDSDAPQVGSARSDSTKVVKVNRRKTNRRKTRPYCTCIRHRWQATSCFYQLPFPILSSKSNTLSKNCTLCRAVGKA